ncbi:MAG: nucleoside 2-deoxyribosyltransferase [Phycisphaeraceae bacterium]|nr:nucleoside 2-deoxyribosyltransferase [Phycisphaeraceae bacterium]
MQSPAYQPDFDNLSRILSGGQGFRVPTAELGIDVKIKEKLLGRHLETLADEIEFRYRAGYDFAWLSVGMIDPAGTVSRQFLDQDDKRHFSGRDDRVWARMHEGCITSSRDLDHLALPDPARLDYSEFIDGARLLKTGMKFVGVLGKIFTASWMLMGMEDFCEGIYGNPALVEALVRRIGEMQVAVAEQIVRFDSVGALWLPDDVAYHTGPMVSPQWLDEHVFNYYRRIVEAAHRYHKPVIYHSDGNMMPLIPIILDCGFDALNPIEPESMDIYKLREQVGTRLCLVGNIRVHTLATGSPQEIRSMVRERIQRLGRDGAYVVASSNSIPDYVPYENFRAMIDAVAEYATEMV